MITIRPYEPGDLQRVVWAWEHATRLAHPFLTEEFVTSERHDLEHVYLPNTHTWVCLLDEAVVGFIALIDNEIGGLFVHPEHHGRGAGRALVDKARELQGDLEVQVFEDNAVGRRFYDRYGFTLMGRTVHSDTGQSLLRLRFRVDPGSGGASTG